MAECRTNSPTNFCRSYLDSRCVVYSGANLLCTGINTNDRLEEILEKIDARICTSVGTGTVTSVAASITSGAISIAGSPITTSGTLAFTYTGTTSQYIRGDGSLATVPSIPVLTNEWHLTGNSGTTAGTNFIGTTDAVDFVFKTNNTDRGRFVSTGGLTLLKDATINTLTVGLGSGNIPNNTVLGASTFQSNTTGSFNVAVGYATLLINETGSFNTAVGVNALSFYTGSFNTAFGANALGGFSLTGIYNTATGWNALSNNTTGFGNTANGVQALSTNSTGSTNAAFGMNALFFNTIGEKNSAFGAGALENNTTGGFNVGIGQDSLLNNTTGIRNIGIGWNAKGGAAGFQNILIGYGTGSTLTSGNSNVFIGYSAAWHASQKVDPVNSIAIGNNSYTTADNQAVFGNATTTQTIFWGALMPNNLPGTSGYVLTSQGANVSPIWVNPTSIVTATPTWQETLTEGSLLDQVNSIDGDGNSFTFDNMGDFLINRGANGRLSVGSTGTQILSSDNSRSFQVNDAFINMIGLTNLSTQDRLLGQFSTAETIGYITLGGGLSLASGILSSSTIATAVPLSGLTAATVTNIANHGTFAQEHQWNTLAGNTGFKFSSTSTAAASQTQRLVDIHLSGTNVTASERTVALSVYNQHGGSGTNVAGYFDAASGTTNIAIEAVRGNVNLNTTSGNVNIGSLTASQAVFTDASKNLVSNAISGTGNVAMTTSPSFTTPALGTPSAAVLTNATGLPEGGLSLTDITTNNSSTSKHGFLLKLNNSAVSYMDGTGTWSTPTGTGVSSIGVTSPITSTGGLTPTIGIGGLTTVGTALQLLRTNAGATAWEYFTPTYISLTALSAVAPLTYDNTTGVFTTSMATGSLIYRKTAGTGVMEVNTLATLKTDLLLTGTNSGDVTYTGETYLSLTGQVLTGASVNLSGTHVTGTLAAARMPAFTGDITTTVGTVATVLATVNGNVGTFGSATQSAVITANAKGLGTAFSNVTITPAESSITFTDITTNDVSTSAHGFFPKLTANRVYYVNNAGALTALALGASGTVLTSAGATSAPTFTAPSVFTLTNGSGTTANGSAVDWVGTMTQDAIINADRQNIRFLLVEPWFMVGSLLYDASIDNGGFIGFDAVGERGWIGDYLAVGNNNYIEVDNQNNWILLNAPTGEIRFNISLGATSNGDVWTLADNTTGRGAWTVLPTSVSSVTGTANRITSSGGTTPVIDIAATYVGQSSITTLGTITTGVWTGTDVAVTDGGTGRSTSTTAYGLIAAGTTATGAHQTLAAGLTTEILVGGGAALPVWTTATGTGAPVRTGTPTIATPSFTTGFTIGGAAASRKMVVGNGTNFVASTETWAVPGTTGNVLTSDGTNWLSSAPAAGGANTALSNLASVAINTTLLPATAYSASVGSNAKPFNSVYGNFIYGGDMTTTYSGYSGGIMGGTTAHGLLDFVDNGTRIGEFYTTTNSFNFFTDAGMKLNFYTDNDFSAPLIHGDLAQRVGINNSSPAYTLDVGGTLGASGVATFASNVIFGAPARLKGYTVATLPAGTIGDTAYVTDALAPAFLVAVAGGGAVVTTVFYNGATWVAQ